MKRTVTATCVAICLMISLLGISSAQAVNSTKQAELLASCQKIQQYLVLPPETLAEHRALVALNIAIAQAQPLDKSIDLAKVLREASSFTTYLVQSDTFYLWSTDHWEGIHRLTYTYSGNRMTSEVEQTWDSASASWVNANQTLGTYNRDGTPNTWTQQEWLTDQWMNVYLMSFTYSDGMMSTLLMQTWSGSAWVNDIRVTLTYSGGNLTAVITEMWQTSAWVNFSKTSYTYSGDHLTEWILQSWVSSDWVNSVRGTSTYNGSGWETQSIIYTWQGAAWVNASKYNYSYDGSGNEILDLYSIWAGTVWIAMEADTFKWSDGKNTEIVYNYLIPQSVARTQYTYDAHGNRTVDLGQDWSGSTWVNSDRAVYVYQQLVSTNALLISPLSGFTQYEGDTVYLLVSATDPDFTIPTLTAQNVPDSATFADSSNGHGGFYWPIAAKQYGTFNMSFIASDGVFADTEEVAIQVSARPPQIADLSVEGSQTPLNVTAHVPTTTWRYVDFANDDPQLKFEIAVGIDSDWTSAEMWNPAPFSLIDTFVVYNGAPLVDGMTYWLRLRVNNSLAWSEWKQLMFRMNSAPSAVTLIVPADSLITPLASLRPTFCWTASTDPDPYDTLTYDLTIARDTNFTSVEQQIPNLTDTSHTLTTDLLWGKRYWWKVKANDLNGDSTWSTQVFTFRTMTLGDADNDGSITIADVVFLVEYIFSHGPAPSPYASGDADCDGEITIADAVYLIAYIFSQGSAPCAGSK